MTFLEFSLEPGVPQWSIPAASPPLRCHSIPSQQPIGIRIAHFARTTLKSGGFISRPRLAPARIWLSPVFEITSPDLASLHLLSSNPLPNPSPGLPSRQQLTGPYREAREAGQQRPGLLYLLLPRSARPDTRLEVDAALPEVAALDRRSRPPTVLDIADPSQTEGEPQPGPSLPRRPRSRPSRKRRRNRSTGVYRPKKHSPPRGHWCD